MAGSKRDEDERASDFSCYEPEHEGGCPHVNSLREDLTDMALSPRARNSNNDAPRDTESVTNLVKSYVPAGTLVAIVGGMAVLGINIGSWSTRLQMTEATLVKMEQTISQMADRQRTENAHIIQALYGLKYGDKGFNLGPPSDPNRSPHSP